MLKLIGKSILLAVIVCAVMSAMSSSLDHFFTAVYTDEKPFWILNQHNRRYDFAVLGSSRAENVVDIATLEKLTGKKGINLGVQGTNHAGLFLVLQRFLQNNNTVGELLVQVDEYALDSKKSYLNPFQTYAYLPYISDQKVRSIIKANTPFERYAMWENLPFSRYVDYNSYYLSYLMNYLLKIRRTNYELTKGSMLEKGSERYVFDRTVAKAKAKVREIDQNDVKYLEDIIRLAQRSGVRVVLFTSPQYYEYLPYINSRERALGVIAEIAKKWSITYVNYENDRIAFDSSLFADTTHLNATGSVRFSTKLSELITHAGKERDTGGGASPLPEVIGE